MNRALKFAVCLVLSMSLIFCSSSDYTSSTLANQGILPLSSSNAYLGTNLYLAKQAENSQVLYNFLEAKGGPTAMELVDEGFKGPRLILYYAKSQEAFSAELEEQNLVKEWIIRGPYAMKRSDFSSVSRIQTINPGEPVFVVSGRQKRFKIDRELALATPTPLPTKIPTFTPTARPPLKKPKIKPTPQATSEVITAPKATEPSITDFKPMNSDQQAISMAKGYAERADNGDVIHTIKADGEAINTIAKWYTGSEENGKVLQSANGIEEGKTLIKGQRIRVPMKLLKNLKQMP